MTTGYTYRVADGTVTSLKEYVMVCARAFGACIDMRDLPSDAEIPEAIEPNSYHTDRLKEETARLWNLEAMSTFRIIKAAKADHQRALEAHYDYLDSMRDKRKRYQGMMEQVKAWVPPTDHSELKKFMIQQLEDSIKYDCNESYVSIPEPQTPEEWYESQVAKIQRSIEYHQEEADKERARATERTQWVRDLRDNLRKLP